MRLSPRQCQLDGPIPLKDSGFPHTTTGSHQKSQVKGCALQGLRKDKSPEALLRTLLIHLGCGHSLRETVVRARQAEIAELSDVALLKRLRKSRDWLSALCVALFQEHGIVVSDTAHPMRAI